MNLVKIDRQLGEKDKYLHLKIKFVFKTNILKINI